MSVRLVSSTNSKLSITIPGLFPTANNIEGYAVEDFAMLDPVQVAETMIGIDGKMSAGRLPVITPMTITLMASSKSRIFFDLWNQASKTANTILPASVGVLIIPDIQATYNFINGVLHTTPQMPAIKRTLQPMQWIIHWEDVQILPFAP